MYSDCSSSLEAKGKGFFHIKGTCGNLLLESARKPSVCKFPRAPVNTIQQIGVASLVFGSFVSAD